MSLILSQELYDVGVLEEFYGGLGRPSYHETSIESFPRGQQLCFGELYYMAKRVSESIYLFIY